MKTTGVSLKFLLPFLVAAIFAKTPSLAQKISTWQELTSVEDICLAYPDRMQTMLDQLNLDLAGLDVVKVAVSNNDLRGACEALLKYYQTGNTAQFLRKENPTITTNSTSKGDSIIHDIYVFQLVGDRVPRLADGHLNWDCTGPEDDIEWAWALNRHYPINELIRIYFETGNADYARYIDSFIKDWIIQSTPYPAVKSSTAMWRGLEVSFRAKVWSQVFYGLMDSGYLSDATKLLILSSLPEHAHYARNFHAQNNWLTMEMSGLATVAVAWPEYKESGEWLDYAINSMTESMKEQVYPDGAQTELTSSYHYVALNNFLQLRNICQAAGKQLPEFYIQTINQMYDYLALTMRPDGMGLLNNDADLISNRDIIINALKDYNRNDWEYIATNGKKGILPTDGPSYFFPWAGQLISRSGFDERAHWSFFDIGPWGSGHQHNDKLHVSVSAFGSDFLVDAGRFAYRGEVADKFRGYARGTQGHNTLIFDSKGQAAGPLLADNALSESHYSITENYDYAWGSFNKYNGVDGNLEHTRSLLYVRDKFWIIVDQVTTDKPRKVEALWHWHPDLEASTGENGTTTASSANGKMKIIPIGKQKWQVKQVRGQEAPEIQGWYSKVYNQFEASTASIYSANIKGNSVLVWLIIPAEKEVPDTKVRITKQDSEMISMEVQDSISTVININLPFRDSKGVNVVTQQMKIK